MDFAPIPQTALRVVAQPAAFFREMPKKGGFIKPLVFTAAVAVLSGLLQALQGLLHLNVARGAAAGFASIVLIPVMTAIFSFVGAAILFVIWKLMGSQEDYEAAYRCGAALSALGPITTVLGVIPYLGSAASLLIMVYYLVAASVETHKIGSRKAWTVFGALGAALIVLSLSGQYAARRFSSEMTRSANRAAGQSEEMKKQIEELQKQFEEISKNQKR
jgi:hypothetical protein